MRRLAQEGPPPTVLRLSDETETMVGLAKPADLGAAGRDSGCLLVAGFEGAPAFVTDPTDGQGAHLHGLNLSRAWAMKRLAAALPDGDARIPLLLDSAQQHAEPELSEVSGSDYMVEHWLAAFALLYLDPSY